MRSDVLIQIGLISLLILFNAFLAGSEMAIVSVRKSRIKQLAEDGVRAAAAVMRISENTSRFLATIQVGVTLAGFFASSVGAVSLVAPLASTLRALPLEFVSASADALALIVITVIISYFTLILGELVPKNLAIHHAEGFSLHIARPIELLDKLATPIVSFLTLSTNAVLRLFGAREKAVVSPMTEDEIISMVDAGEEEGVIQPFEGQMIRSVFDFGDTVVREVMVPRIDIVAIEKDSSLDQAVETFLRVGLSRLPVFDDSVDNIVGILYAKDLLRFFREDARPSDLAGLCRQPVFVPESKPLGDLFRELQQSRTHMAIVVDEYGGTAGLVTMEDMLEEIVGEIRDEHDQIAFRMEVLSAHEVLASGLVSVGDLEDALDVELGPQDVDTVGGLVYAKLGRMPVQGDTVELEGATITVENVSGRRIRQVRVVKTVPPARKEHG